MWDSDSLKPKDTITLRDADSFSQTISISFSDLRDESRSTTCHELSKINFLKTSTIYETGKECPSKSSKTSFSFDNSSYAMYDRLADQFYGVPTSGKMRALHWENSHLAGSWGNRAFEFACWDDSERLSYKSRHYHNLKLTEEEEEGVLTRRIIAACSSFLDKSPETDEYALCKCVMANKGLSEISALRNYHYIQYLDISRNRITTLEALGQLPFLMYLDASFNLLKTVLDFKAPFNLMFVNLSTNDIKTIRDLSDFWSIIVMDLSHNEIEVISGLENLKYLRGLNLSYNWISKVEGLNNLERLQCLNLYNNIINRFEVGQNVGFKTNIRLKKLSLAKNLITSLEIIEEARFLQTVDFSDNRIQNISELVYLKDLPRVFELDLRVNPIRTNVRYFVTCLNYCRNLINLDGEEVTAELKVISRKKFETTTFEYVKTGTQHILLNNINFPNMTRSIIPYTDPPRPMIVLVGPPSSLKGLIVDICCETYPNYVTRGINHTTRPKSAGEIDGEQYHFVSYETFKNMMRRGLFYTTSEYFGHLYGLAQSEVSKAETNRTVLILHSDLNGGIMLRARGLRPTLVLTIPKSEEMHRKYLRKKYYCHSLQEGILEVSVSKIRAYEGLTRMKKYTHRNILKGVKKMLMEFFQMINKEIDVQSINNLDVAFTGGLTLRKLLGNTQKEYMDITGHEVSDATEFKNWYLMLMEQMDCKLLCLDDLTSAQKLALNELGIDKLVKELLFKESEYNSETQEERSNVLQGATNIQRLFDVVIDSRKTYFEMHWSNPGLFSQVVFTDDIDHGFDVLRMVLKTCVQTYHLRSPVCNMKHHPKDHVIVRKRLEKFHEMMSPRGIVENEKRNCKKNPLGFQNVEGKSYVN